MTVQASERYLEDYRQLLEDSADLQILIERPPTFIEIARYHRRENAYSNILAFFMNPKEPHGFGTLALDAFAHAGGLIGEGESVGKILSVEREVTVDERKRIDLLIETDAHVILIENKIDARSDNPFSEYSAYVDQMVEGRTPHKILLTLSQNDAGREFGFRNLTYDKFIGQVRLNIGRYITGADTRYLTLLLDFLNTVENLRKGTCMNKEFVNLLAERESQVEYFLTGLEELKKEMFGKAQELKDRIDIDKHGDNVEPGKLWQYPIGPYVDLPYDIYVSEKLVVQIETSIFPKGWHIWLWPSTGDYQQLKDHLNQLNIPFREFEKDGAFEHLDSFKHKYNENLDSISSLLQELTDKLATAEEIK